MDLEVSKAFRTLQRAGIVVSPLSPQMSIEEIKSNYGALIRQWLEQQGICCILMPKGVGASQASISRAAQQHLTNKYNEDNQTTAVVKITHLDSYGNRRVLHDTTNSNSVMDNYWSVYSPEGMESYIARQSVLKHIKNKEPLAVLFFPNEYDGNTPGTFVTVNLYAYRAETADEIAKKKEREDKGAAAAEKRRQTLEAKDKALLKKLQDKYGRQDPT
jgi:hypothetical protein